MNIPLMVYTVGLVCTNVYGVRYVNRVISNVCRNGCASINFVKTKHPHRKSYGWEVVQTRGECRFLPPVGSQVSRLAASVNRLPTRELLFAVWLGNTVQN